MSFEKLVLTNKGRTLLAKGLAGSVINFTQIKMGDGTITSQVPAALNDVISEKVRLKIGSLTKGDQYTTVSSTFKNTAARDSFTGDGSTKAFRLSAAPSALSSVTVGGASTTAYTYQGGTITFTAAPASAAVIVVTYNLDGFYFREVGIFAQDPDVGEILFAYQNAYQLAEYIAAASSEIVEKIVSAAFIFGSATTVTATIDASTLFMTAETGQVKTELLSAGDTLADDDSLPLYDKSASKSAAVTLLLLWTYLKDKVDNILKGYAAKATTLAGYNIGDAYTKTETDTKLSSKAASSHSHVESEITGLSADLALKGNTQTYTITDSTTLTIPTSAWAANTNSQAETAEKTAYPYMATLSIPSSLTGGKAVTADDTGESFPNYADSISGNFFEHAYTTAGGIIIEAVTKPTAAMTLLQVNIERRLS